MTGAPGRHQGQRSRASGNPGISCSTSAQYRWSPAAASAVPRGSRRAARRGRCSRARGGTPRGVRSSPRACARRARRPRQASRGPGAITLGRGAGPRRARPRPRTGCAEEGARCRTSRDRSARRWSTHVAERDKGRRSAWCGRVCSWRTGRSELPRGPGRPLQACTGQRVSRTPCTTGSSRGCGSAAGGTPSSPTPVTGRRRGCGSSGGCCCGVPMRGRHGPRRSGAGAASRRSPSPTSR